MVRVKVLAIEAGGAGRERGNTGKRIGPGTLYARKLIKDNIVIHGESS